MCSDHSSLPGKSGDPTYVVERGYESTIARPQGCLLRYMPILDETLAKLQNNYVSDAGNSVHPAASKLSDLARSTRPEVPLRHR